MAPGRQLSIAACRPGCRRLQGSWRRLASAVPSGTTGGPKALQSDIQRQLLDDKDRAAVRAEGSVGRVLPDPPAKLNLLAHAADTPADKSGIPTVIRRFRGHFFRLRLPKLLARLQIDRHHVGHRPHQDHVADSQRV